MGKAQGLACYLRWDSWSQLPRGTVVPNSQVENYQIVCISRMKLPYNLALYCMCLQSCLQVCCTTFVLYCYNMWNHLKHLVPSGFTCSHSSEVGICQDIYWNNIDSVSKKILLPTICIWDSSPVFYDKLQFVMKEVYGIVIGSLYWKCVEESVCFRSD